MRFVRRSLRLLCVALLTLLPWGLAAQNPFLRPSLELGLSSSRLRLREGSMQGIQGLRAGAGLELSLGLLTYLSTGLYYQQQGANQSLSRPSAQPLDLRAAGGQGTEQLRFGYLNIPLALGLRVAVPFVGVGLSGELGLSYSRALTGSYHYAAASGERFGPADYNPYLRDAARGGFGLRSEDLALHLAAKLELGHYYLRLGLEHGLRQLGLGEGSPQVRTTSSWFTVGYTLF